MRVTLRLVLVCVFVLMTGLSMTALALQAADAGVAAEVAVAAPLAIGPDVDLGMVEVAPPGFGSCTEYCPYPGVPWECCELCVWRDPDHTICDCPC
jgi:hypothetical protein